MEVFMRFESTCFNCGKELLGEGLEDDKALAIIRFDAGDVSVGQECSYFLECLECCKERGVPRAAPSPEPEREEEEEEG